MERFTTLTAVAAPIDQPNVDTDQLIPARFMRKPRSVGYQRFLFHDQRFDGDGGERPDFPLNRPEWREARILVAERNFGCGSSREAAVYALVDAGIRCVVAPSFGDIFFNNAVENGLLLVALEEAATAELRRRLHDRPGQTLTVDLPAQTVTAEDGTTWSFEIDAARKRRLAEGLDAIGLTRELLPEIDAFEARRAAAEPWAALDGIDPAAGTGERP